VLVPPEHSAPFDHVLVATDFSPMADHALARAGRLPTGPQTRFIIAHVLPDDVPRKLHAQVEEFARQRLEQARMRLVAQLADSGRPRPTVSPALLHGQVCPELMRCARVEGAELIALGRQGTQPLKALLMGSTAEGIFRAGVAPTLIVARPPRANYRRPLIAAALDAGDAELVTRAWRVLGSDVRRATLLHAYQVPFQELLPWARASNVLMPLRKHHRELASAGIAELESSLAGLAVCWDAMSVRGDPRHAILVESLRRGSDLIAVGSHARSRLAQAWAGSVAEAVVRAATRDVLVVPLPEAPLEPEFGRAASRAE
jgi:nucleotide-binding universal stress UspA family protein